jgi:putative endonuclease
VPFVYLLCCRDGTLYAGAAVDLERRLREHQAGRASRYTRSRRPVELVWSVEVATWSEALREEARVKRLPRTGKLALRGRSGDDARVRATETTRRPSGAEG